MGQELRNPQEAGRGRLWLKACLWDFAFGILLSWDEKQICVEAWFTLWTDSIYPVLGQLYIKCYHGFKTKETNFVTFLTLEGILWLKMEQGVLVQ